MPNRGVAPGLGRWCHRLPSGEALLAARAAARPENGRPALNPGVQQMPRTQDERFSLATLLVCDRNGALSRVRRRAGRRVRWVEDDCDRVRELSENRGEALVRPVCRSTVGPVRKTRSDSEHPVPGSGMHPLSGESHEHHEHLWGQRAAAGCSADQREKSRAATAF